MWKSEFGRSLQEYLNESKGTKTRMVCEGVVEGSKRKMNKRKIASKRHLNDETRLKDGVLKFRRYFLMESVIFLFGFARKIFGVRVLREKEKSSLMRMAFKGLLKEKTRFLTFTIQTCLLALQKCSNYTYIPRQFLIKKLGCSHLVPTH